MENKARVISEYKGAYRVKNENGEFLARVTGKRIFDALSREDYPAVGDWVVIEELAESQAVIKEILPRKTIIKRKQIGKEAVQIIATNIDVAFIIESVDRDFNLNRFERYFAIAKDGGVKPVIILNKIDLISKEELDIKLEQIKNRFDNVDVIVTSIVTKEGLNELKNYMENGKTYCFLGSSGVGKSSLINKLLGRDVIKTENISTSTGKGKHTTTNREMYFLKNGAVVIDNPGMREIGMADASTGVDNLFDDIIALAKSCKYVDCTHTHEPGCNVLFALKFGKLDKEKYLNYISLKGEVEHYEMSELEKREKDKQFGKFVKNAKKELKDRGVKGY
jgi:ribosome biogenesis GTPase